MTQLPKASKALVKQFAEDLYSDWLAGEFYMDDFTSGEAEIYDSKTKRKYLVNIDDLEDAMAELQGLD